MIKVKKIKNYPSLRDLREHRNEWTKAVIVIKQSSFSSPYTVTERSYIFNVDNKYFKDNMIGTSIFATSLDEKDYIKLSDYLYYGWKIERIYSCEVI